MLTELWGGGGSQQHQYWEQEHLKWLISSLTEAKWVQGFNAVMKSSGAAFHTTEIIFYSLDSKE